MILLTVACYFRNQIQDLMVTEKSVCLLIGFTKNHVISDLARNLLVFFSIHIVLFMMMLFSCNLCLVDFFHPGFCLVGTHAQAVLIPRLVEVVYRTVWIFLKL